MPTQGRAAVPDQQDDEQEQTAPTPAGQSGSSGVPAWALAVATFVAGLLLGGGVVALTQSGEDDDVPEAAPSVSPSPSPSPVPTPAGNDVLIRVPGSCVQVAEQAETAVQGFDELAAAARDFDARELQDIVDRLQKLRPQIEALSTQCRDAAGAGIAEGSLVSPAPTTTS